MQYIDPTSFIKIYPEFWGKVDPQLKNPEYVKSLFEEAVFSKCDEEFNLEKPSLRDRLVIQIFTKDAGLIFDYIKSLTLESSDSLYFQNVIRDYPTLKTYAKLTLYTLYTLHKKDLGHNGYFLKEEEKITSMDQCIETTMTFSHVYNNDQQVLRAFDKYTDPIKFLTQVITSDSLCLKSPSFLEEIDKKISELQKKTGIDYLSKLLAIEDESPFLCSFIAFKLSSY